MPNEKNVQIVKEVADKLADAKGIYFTNYKGLTVEQINHLRKELYNSEVEYRVVKKTLTKLAAKKAGFDKIESLIDGQMGIALSYDDPVVPGKVITSFVKKNKLESLDITGCIFEKEIFGAERIDAIVNLPTHEELLAKLLGTLAAPLSQLTNTLKGVMQQFVGVLKSLSHQKESK